MEDFGLYTYCITSSAYDCYCYFSYYYYIIAYLLSCSFQILMPHGVVLNATKKADHKEKR